MADQVRWRGGSRENSEKFTGAAREVTVDTTDWLLRVHDGITPGGHKMMKSGNCLVVEEADKCDPTQPTCKVTVNGDLEVGGNTHIGGDLTIDGTVDLGDIVLDLEADDVLLRNPGDYVAACNVPDGNGLKTQEDANQWFYRAIVVLDTQLCKAQNEIIAIEYQIQKLENDVEANQIAIADLKARVDLLEQAIAILETEIEALGVQVNENSAAIEAIKIAILDINQEIEEIKDWLKAHSLDDHTDVDLSTPSNGDYFVYKNGKWTNEAQCNMKCNTYLPSLATL